jgi:hypothetical protein
MLVFVSVLRVLCAFVVKGPSSVAVQHRTRMAPARMSTTPCLNGVRYSLDVGYQFGAFSRLHAASISVGAPSLHDMHNRSVNKCTYLYRQLPPSALWNRAKTIQMWGNVGVCATTPVVCRLRPSSFVLRPSSFVHSAFRLPRPSLWLAAPPKVYLVAAKATERQ